ncbi:MAG: HAD family hydrolase, partial [Nitrospinota bacterium]
MATPLAMIRGGGMAAERGILMRSGEAFQVLKDIKVVVLDKTGTITRGEPDVVEVVPIGACDAEEVLRLAGSVESSSEHPLARAIVKQAHAMAVGLPESAEFRAVPGKGAWARVDGRTIRVGSLRFTEEEGADTSQATERARTFEEEGKTVV